MTAHASAAALGTAATTATSSRADELSDGTGATSGGQISRVNAFDGLFLRAEHLTRMQDYARELVSALGAAGGSGTVWGYGLTVEGNTLHVAPGLAVDAPGHPLRAHQEMTLDLSGVELAGDQYALVWVARKVWPYGQEPVQGVLCEDPCSGGGSGRPFQAEGVIVGTTTKVEAGLIGGSDERRRNWLASRLFALERLNAGAWPERGGDRVLNRWWGAPATPASLPGEVPLGVLLPGDDGWVVDTWSARRDHDAPPPTGAWQWQLGMRPWNVFVAQILQLQDQLVDALGAGSRASRASATAAMIGKLEDIRELVKTSIKTVTEQRLDDLVKDFRGGELHERFSGPTLVALRAVGIEDLPPAGFLPRFDAVSPESARGVVQEMLGGAADVRVCTGVMGDIGAFISRAQHRERISLEGKGKGAVVDVLWVADADSDWLAFARREEIDCGVVARQPDTEAVRVYVVEQRADEALYAEWRRYLARPSGEHPRLAGDEVELRYPVRTWALPQEPAYLRLVERIRDYDKDELLVELVAIVTEEGRRQLGVGRAGILGVVSGETQLRAHDSYSTIGPVEAIVVLVGVEPR